MNKKYSVGICFNSISCVRLLQVSPSYSQLRIQRLEENQSTTVHFAHWYKVTIFLTARADVIWRNVVGLSTYRLRVVTSAAASFDHLRSRIGMNKKYSVGIGFKSISCVRLLQEVSQLRPYRILKAAVEENLGYSSALRTLVQSDNFSSGTCWRNLT